MADQRPTFQKRAGMLALAVVVGGLALAATAEPASAAVVVQHAHVINHGHAYVNTGGNVVTPDASHSTTSPGGTSVSHGTATVTTGTAKAKGSASITRVRQQAWGF
jgi:hypothetical protein